MPSRSPHPTVAFEGEEWSLIDTDAVTSYVDIVTEVLVRGSTVHLSLGTTSQDMEVSRKIEVTTRLRMNVATARRMHDFLGQLLAKVDGQTPIVVK